MVTQLKKLVIFSIIMSLTLSFPLFANPQSPSEFGITGKEWKKLPDSMKTIIVASYIKGFRTGYHMPLMYMEVQGMINIQTQEHMFETYSFVVPEKEVDDYVTGVTHFYSSKKNKNKDLLEAIWYSIKDDPGAKK
jgi:hypothetical protein